MDRYKAAELLGVSQSPSEEEVKAAYKALAQRYGEDNFEPGPARDEAEARMNEINQAFDVLMSVLRTGQEPASHQGTGAASVPGRYPAIRQMLNTGQVDAALAELSTIQNGAGDAEWNFLMGSAYYYKGYLDQALIYFQTAVRLEPANREYEAALRNLQQSAGGEMPGNPYTNVDPAASTMQCACNTCSLMCCMDACCSMCR